MFHDILIYHNRRNATTIPPNYWHLSFFEYTFFSFFFTRITHAIPLSFFPPRSFASHAHVWTQTQLLNWTACDLSSHITEQASRTHSITILLPLPPLPPPLPPLLLPSSPRPPPPPPLLHILSTAYNIYTRMAAYTPLNRSNQPRRRARTHWQPLLHSHPERATLRTLTALLTHYQIFCIKQSLTDACQLVRVKASNPEHTPTHTSEHYTADGL